MNPEVAFQRSTIYELLSHVFVEPADEFLRFVARREFLEHVKYATQNLLHTRSVGLKELEKATELAKYVGVDLIISEFDKLTSPQKNYFYEGNYHAPANAMEEMTDIAGFYRAFGVGSECERPDYLSAELEFMKLLTMKEARALMSYETESAEICLSAQRAFLGSHLGRWVKGLSLLTSHLSFYSHMCKFLNNWIEAECSFLSIKPSECFYINNLNFNENNCDFCAKETGEYEGI